MPKSTKKIDIKRLPPDAEAILKQCTLQQLTFMINLATKGDFERLVEVTRLMIDRNIQMAFAYPEEDPQKLAVAKARARGKVEEIAKLMYVIKGAEKEIQRRAKEKERR